MLTRNDASDMSDAQNVSHPEFWAIWPPFPSAPAECQSRHDAKVESKPKRAKNA